MLIEGTMETVFKAALCALVLAAAIKVMVGLGCGEGERRCAARALRDIELSGIDSDRIFGTCSELGHAAPTSEEPGMEICCMAKLVFGMNQSLDGYVDHTGVRAQSCALSSLHRASARPDRQRVRPHHVRDHALLGRRASRMGTADQRDFAAAWRRQPKWVVSRTLSPSAPTPRWSRTMSRARYAELKAEHDGEIDVAGPELARSLTDFGLIDEYRLYLHPVVLGCGKPFFAGPRPPLRFVASDRIGEDAIRLTYVPA